MNDWQNFSHERYFASPEAEMAFVVSSDNPLCRVPPGEHEEPFATALSGNAPWWITQPSKDKWDEIHNLLREYLPYVVICNLDTGVNPHNLIPEPLAMESFIPGQEPFDGHGHGTHTASISMQVAPGAQLIVAKVLSNSGGGPSTGILDGLRWARDWRGSDGTFCVVRNLSLGSSSPHQGTIDEIQQGFAAGRLTNASAGNEGPGEGTEGYPAKAEGVPSIGAYRQDREIAQFSSRGNVTVSCPGKNILAASHRSRDGLVSMSGTSMACPWKCGVDALLVALQWASGGIRWRSMEAITNVYKKYAIDAGQPGYDSAHGFGQPDVPRMIADMAHWKQKFFINALS